MIRFLKKLVPQVLINYFKHLPEAILANVIYGFPSRGMKIIGVTGTDGKTTTTNMIYEILKKSGKRVSMVSTIKAVIGDKEFETGFHVTSPTSNFLQKLLREAKDNGSEYMILEVTSHGLDQFRFFGINFEVGVITNVTNEHLDYHKTFENYLMTKAKLIKNAKVAVINADEKHFDRLRHLTHPKCRVLSFGKNPKADFNPGNFKLNLKIPGEYNLLNALAASAATASIGLDKANIKYVLGSFEGLEGRMEGVPNKLGIKIVVDFAHTPNALENSLKVLKKKSKGRLISIFGAASERDVAKRPVMGAISAREADVTILTDEDPRFEPSEKIISEIALGAKKEGAKFGKNLFKEPDRFKAIMLGIKMARKGDTVGIFGKGHEKTMNYKGFEKVWSDKEAVGRVLRYGR